MNLTISTLALALMFTTTYAAAGLAVLLYRLPTQENAVGVWLNTPLAKLLNFGFTVIGVVCLFVASDRFKIAALIILPAATAIGHGCWLFQRWWSRTLGSAVLVVGFGVCPVIVAFGTPVLKTTSGPLNNLQIMVLVGLFLTAIGWLVARVTAERAPSFVPAIWVMIGGVVWDIGNFVVGRMQAMMTRSDENRYAKVNGEWVVTHKGDLLAVPASITPDGHWTNLGDPNGQIIWVPGIGTGDLLWVGAVIIPLLLIVRHYRRPSLMIGAMVGVVVGLYVMHIVGTMISGIGQPALPYLFTGLTLGLWMAARPLKLTRQIFGRRAKH